LCEAFAAAGGGVRLWEDQTVTPVAWSEGGGGGTPIGASARRRKALVMILVNVGTRVGGERT